MNEEVDHAARARDVLGFSRWWLVLAAAAMMAVVGPYQYVWSSLRDPVATNLGIDSAALSTVFTLFVVVQAGSQFPVGWWRDRHGPRAVSVAAAILAGGGYLGLSVAETTWEIYLAYSLGALGVGIVYTVAVNTALKWFPDRRGLTAGVGTMAFAGGSAALVPYVRANTGAGAPVTAYVGVLQQVGVVIFAVVLVGALVLRDPPEGWLSDGSVTDTGPQFTWREMVRTRQFWLMYAMFVAVSGAGLMLTEKIVSYADHLGLAGVIATAAATLLPLAGGIGRLVLGEVSDRVDRTNAMAGAFTLCGLGLFAVAYFGVSGMGSAFVVAVVVATFFWSPQFTLFPSVVGDYYGEKHSSANYALLYSGKIWGGVFGGTVTGAAVVAVGWTETFLLGGTLAVLAGVAALGLDAPSPPDADKR
ncbi:major facilitator superfamily MFS_1 [Halorhabdus utahensis DSM 12940]|uniref:Major facilitator superfamily MFS_1 n=1 Tax=Halorhabdus utahensis (strain DSM 12940 / JCM 11049 / AX-2) TaxID=519442 RepID=C7NSY9_HALUD|nr:OFA family MFS transporter [Halorhabdus utahensis]ACV12064.1 major facilitator superfamily MFS_1 [Halorhabdus utahensis DSM 12940]